MTKTEVEIEHMLWTVSYSPEAGAWFSLRPVEHDKQLFSGPIHEGMADELRELAKAVAKIEKEIAESVKLVTAADGLRWCVWFVCPVNTRHTSLSQKTSGAMNAIHWEFNSNGV